jgi:hypothetical protein
MRRRSSQKRKGTRRRQAAKWEDVATVELAEEEGDDPEDFDWKKGPFRNSITVEEGRREWLVFEDEDDAVNACSDYISDLLDDDLESYVGADLLQHYLEVSPTDRSILAQEEADSYIEDLTVDELDTWVDTSPYYEASERIYDIGDEISDLEEQAEAYQDQLDDFEDSESDADSYDSLADMHETAKEDIKKLQKERDDLEASLDTIVDDLKEEAAEAFAKEVEDRLKTDLLGWLEDYGYDLSKASDLPSFITIDDIGLVEALMQDGVEYWFAGYDHTQVELDSGAVAYRQN